MNPGRRRILATLAATGAGGLSAILAAARAPAVLAAPTARPAMPSGIMSGDVDGDRAVIWSRTDRPARLWVEYTTGARFERAVRVRGPAALMTTDFTARVDLAALPRGATVQYRAWFEDLATPGLRSAPLAGSFRVPPRQPTRDLVFAFSGDEAGQGFGINPEAGGYRLYDAVLRHAPDVFIHCGDQVYADGPLQESLTLADGRVWRNLVTPAKARVAQSLDDFRGNYAYNLLDAHKRACAAEVPFLVQWDDHETRNNWYPGQQLDDPRYDRVRSVDLLAAHANRALREYNPLRWQAQAADRLYRACDLGPLAEVFLLDLRSHRGAPSANRQAAPSAATALFGAAQFAWLKARLLASRACWKIIVASMPIGLVVPDRHGGGVVRHEGIANGDAGAARGRELAIAALLAFLREHGIVNTVWLTADVHYAAAHHYDPGRARGLEFLPFWEFVAGPINAGTFGPNALDATFGPEVRFARPVAVPGQSPLDGGQYFGLGRIDHRTRELTVGLRDIDDRLLWETTLAPL
ncbi:MAG: alkaline phosphatase D family protein [Gammaproteobacteria bacterium]